MAANTGPDINTYQIPEVLLGDTFNVWKDISNTSIYKLNKMGVYAGVSSSNLIASTDQSGNLSMMLAPDISTGHTFSASTVFTNGVRFDSGVTFNGPVVFNADTFTVNANIVTIDDYSIVLGDTAGASDENISSAGGGGLILNRGSGNTADWLWTPTNLHGAIGMWSGNGHIGFKNSSGGISPVGGGNLLVHGTGIRVDGGSTSEHGLLVSLAGNGTTTGRTVALSRYSPAGSTAFIEVETPRINSSRPFVSIKDGANKKTIYQLNHQFDIGTPVRIDPFTGKYEKAQADNPTNSEVIGIVSKTPTPSDFELTFLGEVFDIEWSSLTTDGSSSGITGAVYYLSADVAGKITSSPPTLKNTVHKAVFVASSSSSVIVIPWTGGVLTEAVTLANSTSNTVTIPQINRFKPGDVVRFNYVQGGTALSYGSGAGLTSATYAHGVYVRADAKNALNADNVAGVVVSTTPFTGVFSNINESFDLMMDGFFTVPVSMAAVNSGTQSTLIPGNNYFLNVNCAGTTGAFEGITSCLVNAAPSGNDNFINKPVLFATSPTSGYVYSYRGTQTVSTFSTQQVPLTDFLIRDIRSSGVGDLAFHVYDPASSGGAQVMVFERNNRGNIRVGSTSFTETSVGAGATLSVAGTIVAGDRESTSGSVLLASRYEGKYPITLNTIGTHFSTGNTVVGYGVRPTSGSLGYTRTTSQSTTRTALEVGIDSSGTIPGMRLLGYYNTAHALPGRTGGTGVISLTPHFEATSLRTWSSSTLGVGMDIAHAVRAPLHVQGALTTHGAANRGTILVSGTGNDSQGTTQLQIGVAEGVTGTWIESWQPGIGGATLSIQPTGGRTVIGGPLMASGGISAVGRSTMGGFMPNAITNIGVAAGIAENSTFSITVPGTATQRYMGIMMRPSYSYDPGDSFASFYLNQSGTPIELTGGSTVTGNYNGAINQGAAGANATKWLYTLSIWWWRVS